MARLEVDMTRCDGHGICALLFPEMVDLDRYGYATVGSGELAGSSLRAARRAVRACPARALVLVGDTLGAVPTSAAPTEAR